MPSTVASTVGKILSTETTCNLLQKHDILKMSYIVHFLNNKEDDAYEHRESPQIPKQQSTLKSKLI